MTFGPQTKGQESTYVYTSARMSDWCMLVWLFSRLYVCLFRQIQINPADFLCPRISLQDSQIAFFPPDNDKRYMIYSLLSLYIGKLEHIYRAYIQQLA